MKLNEIVDTIKELKSIDKALSGGTWFVEDNMVKTDDPFYHDSIIQYNNMLAKFDKSYLQYKDDDINICNLRNKLPILINLLEKISLSYASELGIEKLEKVLMA